MDSQQSSEGTAPQLIAYAYMAKEGDRRNVLQLTENALHITYRGKNRAFSLAYVQQLSLEHRKLWLPLIAGGIMSSLSLLALLHTFTMPFRLLAIALAGLVLMWWGYRGSMALVVYEQRHHNDFLLASPGPSLQLFIAFANRLIRRYPQPMGNYSLHVSVAEWQQLQQRGVLELEEPRFCMPEEWAQRQPADPEGVWLSFDPLRMGDRLQWSLQGKELVATLGGTLKRSELGLPNY